MPDLVRTLRHELIIIEAEIPQLEAEASQVQSRLRRAFEKADKIKGVIALYADENVEAPQPELFEPPFPVQESPPQAAEPIKQGEQEKSKALRVREEVVELLGLRGTEHRSKILDRLIEKGLMGSERNPLASLASYLSDNKDVFAADGRGNFSLRQREHQEPPPVSHAGAGFAEAAGSGTTSDATFNVQH